MKRKAFTLIELLVVIAIMGLMGTAAVGGYRAMQRGMEERGVMQNVNQFVRTAFQRAQIDRVPVTVYFWNETLREESDTNPILVVGKAVAVRRAGRLTEVMGDELLDEFGDLRYHRLTLDEDEGLLDEQIGTSQTGKFIYPMDNDTGTTMRRSIISQNAFHCDEHTVTLTSHWNLEDKSAPLDVYAFKVIDNGGVSWNRGTAYGFEFAEIQLPNNYIFKSSYSQNVNNPVVSVEKLQFRPNRIVVGGKATVEVSSFRPNKSGDLTPQKVNVSDDPRNEVK